MKKIQVDNRRRAFVDSDGRPFTPFGISYFRSGTGWAPQLWKQFDAEATKRDFALLKEHGANCVRVFITTASFWSRGDQLNSDGIAKFDMMLDFAEEAGLYVQPTGPDRWEGCPSWLIDRYGSDDSMDGNQDYLRSLAGFWKMFAGRYKGRNTIWAYDLLNEPSIAWDTSRLRARWAVCRKEHSKRPVPIPDPSAPTSLDLLDFQHFRESLAEEWTSIQATAIHEADPDALVTVGLIQWSVPATPFSPQQYAAFCPAKIAPYLDFMELHYYPFTGGPYTYQSREMEIANLSVVESMSRECAKPGLPLVIAEFGWYGGGTLFYNGASGTEENQAKWCRHLIETTSQLSCGWLNWSMYDTPEAKDVSTFTGLFTSDGKEKAWGRTFLNLARGFATTPPTFQFPQNRPDLPWDKCIVSAQAMDDFCQSYQTDFVQSLKAVD